MEHVRLHPLWSAAKSVWKIIRWQGDMLAKKLCTLNEKRLACHPRQLSSGKKRQRKREFTSSLTSFVVVFWFNVQAIRVKWLAHMSLRLEHVWRFSSERRHNKEARHRAQIRLNQFLLCTRQMTIEHVQRSRSPDRPSYFVAVQLIMTRVRLRLLQLIRIAIQAASNSSKFHKHRGGDNKKLSL